MIRNIIFDIGQVLAQFRWKEYIKDFGFAEEVNERLAAATVLSPYWEEVDRGVMSMDAIIEGCIQSDPEIEKEIRMFFYDRRRLVVEFDYAEEFVKHLKEAGYGIYLLSNYGEENFSYVKDIFRFMKYVDGSVISYEVKAIKPEPVIYETLLKKYHLIPEECVFLDDLERNLEGAGAFGIHTVHFTGLVEGKAGLRNLGISCDGV